MADLEYGFRCLCVVLCVGLSSCFTNSLDVDFRPKVGQFFRIEIAYSQNTWINVGFEHHCISINNSNNEL